MIITGMAHFESVCKKKLVDWYHKNKPGVEIDLSNVFVVWACKTLQNYKCLASTTISGDGIYAEYTYNGDKQELYEDVYGKLTNTCITEEFGKEADNFNVTRRLTVINARTDTILLQLEGTFSLSNNSTNELEIICEVGDGIYQKHFVYLNDYTLYVVEDISGSGVDKYHYEINFLPQYGFKVTHSD